VKTGREEKSTNLKKTLVSCTGRIKRGREVGERELQTGGGTPLAGCGP